MGSTRNIVHVHILHSAPLSTLCARNNYYLLIPTIGYFYVCRSMRWSSNVKDPFRQVAFLSQPNTGNGRVPRVVVKILSSNVIVNYVRSLDLIMYEINCYKICRNILVQVIFLILV